ncbi:MAG: sigma-70 family RNA polymerase sigma factor [Alphaproteobacteria bacterium]|nr:sigma-70 family RNA polymerase sigma factor [Alphaproteobacteria bacterium]
MSFHDDLKAILPQLRRHALALTRNRHGMEDLVQDTVVRALAAQTSFQPGTNFAAWMHKILRNEFISGIRKKRDTVPLDDVVAKRIAVAESHDDRLVLRELVGAIDRLPVAQREALLLSTLSELNHDQIADVMGCRTGTVKSRISRARRQLHEDLLGVSASDVPAPEARRSDRGGVSCDPADTGTAAQTLL